MSVLVNLLPDLRLQRQKDAERKRLVGGVAFLIWVVCGVIVGVLLLVVSSQALLIAKTKNDITSKKEQLTNLSGIKDALNAQAKLSSLATLEAQKPVMNKLLTVLGQVSPSTLQITAFKYESTGMLSISGSVKSYAEVAKFVKAMQEGNTLGANGSAGSSPYFTNVVLSTVSRGSNTVDFTITATVASGAIHGN